MPHSRRTHGYTLFELLMVMAIVGIFIGIVAMSVKGLHNDADTAASSVTAALVQARTTAFSTTKAVRVKLSSPTTLLFESNTTCSAITGWTPRNDIAVTFNTGVTVTPTTALATLWNVCYTTRGDLLTAAPSTLTVADNANHSRVLTVYLTGSVSQ